MSTPINPKEVSWQERLEYSHPSLKPSKHAKPLVPAEILAGLDWEHKEQYDEKFQKEIEKQLEQVNKNIEKNPAFVIQKVKQRYESLGDYLPPTIKSQINRDLRGVYGHQLKQQRDSSVFSRMEKEDPGSVKELKGKAPELLENINKEIEGEAQSRRPLFSIGDTGHVIGELAKGFGKEVLGRGKEAYQLSKGALPGTSIDEALAKGREVYETTTGPWNILKPTARLNPTRAGDVAENVLEKIGEGFSWLTTKGAQGISAATKPFVEPETSERVEKVAKEALDIGLALGPLVPKGLGKLRIKGKIKPGAIAEGAEGAEGIAAAASAIEPMVEAVAKADTLQDVVKASELHPHLKEKLASEAKGAVDPAQQAALEKIVAEVGEGAKIPEGISGKPTIEEIARVVTPEETVIGVERNKAPMGEASPIETSAKPVEPQNILRALEEEQARSKIPPVEEPSLTEKASKLLSEEEIAKASGVPLSETTTSASALGDVTSGILDKVKGWGAKAKESVGEFFDPFSTLPDKAKYEAERGAWKGLESSINHIAQPIIQEIKTVSPESRRNIYRAIENGDGSGLSAKEFEVYNTVVASNDILGESLVKRGYIPAEDFAELKGKYIPHTYLDNFFSKEKAPSGGTVGGGIQMDTSLLKDRTRFNYEDRLAHGLVEDVGVGFEKHVKDTSKMIAADNMLHAVVDNPNWVWRDSFVKVGKGAMEETVPMQQLPNLIEVQKKVVESMPLDSRSPAMARLQNLEQALKENKSSAPPANFKLVPDTPGYGPLRGLHVHKAIADDLIGFFTPVDELKNSSPIVKAVGNAAQNAVAFWKVTKTVLNVPSWMRNFGEATVRLNLSGVRFYEIPKLYASAISEMKSGGKLFREAQARGLLQTTFSDAELKPAAALVTDWARKPQPDFIGAMTDGANSFTRALPQNLGRMAGGLATKVVDFSSKVYQSGDSLMVLAKYIAERRSGKSAQAAFEGTVPWAMDYSIADPAIKSGRKYLAPFVSYPYKVAPVLVKALKEHPEAFVKYTMLPWVFSNVTDKNLGNVTHDEVRSLITMFSDTVSDYGTFYVWPTKTPTGNITLSPINYVFPWSPFTDLVSSAMKGDVRESLGITTLGNPFLDLYSLVNTARDGVMYDNFTGRPLYNPLDSTVTKILKVGGNQAEKLLLPPFLTSSGALGQALSIMFNTEYAEKKDLHWRNVIASLCGLSTTQIGAERMKRVVETELGAKTKQWSTYSKTTTDDPEVYKENYAENLKDKFFLKYPAENRPKDIPIEKYREYTLTGPGKGELSDKEKLKMLGGTRKRDKKYFNELIHNLDVDKIVPKK